MATTQIEIERKYDVSAAVAVPDVSEAAGIASVEPRGTAQLEAVYFDTERGDLAAQRITLRRRTGGSDEGWHVKLPAGVGSGSDAGRTELHAPLGRAPVDTARVPRTLLDAVRAHVRDRPLLPVARISTTRSTWHLRDAEGRAVAELADDTVSATAVRDGTVRGWREWEAELIPGDRDDDDPAVGSRLLDSIEGILVAAGAHPSASSSKLAHALGRDALGGNGTGSGLPAGGPAGGSAGGLADGSDGGPAGGSVGGLADGSDGGLAAAALAGAVIRDLVVALKAADPAVRRKEYDSVHAMRSVARRLRSTLASFGSVFDRATTDDLRQGLRRLGAALGDARDRGVRADRARAEFDALPAGLGASGAVDDARRRIVEGTAADFRRATTRALRYLSSARYYRLLDDLDAFVADPPLGPHADRAAREQVPRIVARELARTAKRARAAKRALVAELAPAAQRAPAAKRAPADQTGGAPDTAQELHDARKAARRLRFTVAAIDGQGSGLLGRDARRVAAAAKRVQSVLGAHRDSMLFAEYLLEESRRAHAAGESTFVLGVLHERALSKARDSLAESRDALRALRTRAKRWAKDHSAS